MKSQNRKTFLKRNTIGQIIEFAKMVTKLGLSLSNLKTNALEWTIISVALKRNCTTNKINKNMAGCKKWNDITINNRLKSSTRSAKAKSKTQRVKIELGDKLNEIQSTVHVRLIFVCVWCCYCCCCGCGGVNVGLVEFCSIIISEKTIINCDVAPWLCDVNGCQLRWQRGIYNIEYYIGQ